MIGVEATVLTCEGPLTGIGRATLQLCRALDALRPGRIVLLTDPGRRVAPGYLSGTRLRTRHYSIFRSLDIPVVYPHDRLLPRTRAVGVGIIHDLYAVYGVNTVSPVRQLEGLLTYQAMADSMDGLLCNSEFTRREFLRYFEYPAARCRVAHLGVDDSFSPRPADVAPMRARLGLGERPYLMFTGLHHPNKNLVRLIEGYAASGLWTDHDLVISGPSMADRAESFRIRQTIERHGLGARVHTPGYVDFGTLVALYSGAAAYLFPSVCEGFGLPILEAMRCGAPVLTSDRTACPDVAGGHAVLVDPYSVAAIAAGMREAVAMSPAARRAAQAHAEAATWLETARIALDFIDGLTGR